MESVCNKVKEEIEKEKKNPIKYLIKNPPVLAQIKEDAEFFVPSKDEDQFYLERPWLSRDKSYHSTEYSHFCSFEFQYKVHDIILKKRERQEPYEVRVKKLLEKKNN
jgi:hypothetical protein